MTVWQTEHLAVPDGQDCQLADQTFLKMCAVAKQAHRTTFQCDQGHNRNANLDTENSMSMLEGTLLNDIESSTRISLVFSAGSQACGIAACNTTLVHCKSTRVNS